MRHRRRGRKLGRNPSHQRALLRNLASALILTERDPDLYDTTDPRAPKPPKVPGRIVTTIEKAKEVRPLVEKCITIARRALPHQDAADELETDADRQSEKWRAWRQSDEWREWNRAIAPVVAARRRVLRLLGNKEAMRIVFEELAPRFADRPGGYTRILQLATPRLGDAGTRAILEFVGKHERVHRKAEKPAFDEAEETEEGEAETEEAAPVGRNGIPSDEAGDSDEQEK
jgi:large subunit ribosomal protein L17